MWRKTGMTGGKGWFRYLDDKLKEWKTALPNYDWKIVESKDGVRTIWSRKK